MKKLNELEIGKTARILKIDKSSKLKRRLLDLGFTDGAEIICVSAAPMRDPKAYRINGAVAAIRNRDAALVYVEPLSETKHQER